MHQTQTCPHLASTCSHATASPPSILEESRIDNLVSIYQYPVPIPSATLAIAELTNVISENPSKIFIYPFTHSFRNKGSRSSAKHSKGHHGQAFCKSLQALQVTNPLQLYVFAVSWLSWKMCCSISNFCSVLY